MIVIKLESDLIVVLQAYFALTNSYSHLSNGGIHLSFIYSMLNKMKQNELGPNTEDEFFNN
jgi:hypothetical protein